MIKSILLIGTVLTTFFFVVLGNKDAKDAKIEVQPTTSKSVLGTATFDNNFVNFMNSDVIPNLVYNIDTRYIQKISKNKLHNSITIRDIFPEKALKGVDLFNENRVVKILEDGDVEEWGSGTELNAKQLKLIRALDYSDDFYLETYTVGRKVVYFISITAESEAQYKGGNEALATYLRAESVKETAGIEQNKLKPGRVVFVINRHGELTSVRLDSSSGYEKFDDKMLKLIQNLPDAWIPAKNEEGEAVEQELVLFFGTQGC